MSMNIDKKRLSTLVFVAMCAAFFLFNLIGGIISSIIVKADRENFMETAETCYGTVTDCHDHTRKGHFVGYYLSLDYTVDGETHHAEKIAVDFECSEGEKIKVYYDPDKPTTFLIEEQEPSYRMAFQRVMDKIIVVGILLFVGCWLFRAFPKLRQMSNR